MRPSKFAGDQKEILLALMRLQLPSSDCTPVSTQQLCLREPASTFQASLHCLIAQEQAWGAANDVLAKLISRRHLQYAEDDGKTANQPGQCVRVFLRVGD
jgi:hypothetical protein